MKFNDITIKVHRFGPLEDVSFKLAPLMIFTGMSSLGKSYANYLVYYFLSTVSNGSIRSYVKERIDKNAVQQTIIFNIDEFLTALADNVEDFMRKFLGDEELTCDVEFKSSKKNRTLTFELKKLEIATSHENEESDVPLPHKNFTYEFSVNGGDRKQVQEIEYAQYYFEYELVSFILGSFIIRSVIFPPGRGAFVGENFSVKSEIGSNMNMYNNFFHDYDYGLKSRIQSKHIGDDDLSDRLLKLTSGGKLITIEGKQFLQLNESQKIALSAGASSVKDLSPWLFYLKNHRLFWSFAYCLEEPEAHQHPSVTVQIADVIAIAMHKNDPDIFHLTTHSDYLIQRLNQLIKLGSIHHKNPSLFAQICEERNLDKYAYIDAKDVHAYYFSKGENGKTEGNRKEMKKKKGKKTNSTKKT